MTAKKPVILRSKAWLVRTCGGYSRSDLDDSKRKADREGYERGQRERDGEVAFAQKLVAARMKIALGGGPSHGDYLAITIRVDPSLIRSAYVDQGGIDPAALEYWSGYVGHELTRAIKALDFGILRRAMTTDAPHVPECPAIWGGNCRCSMLGQFTPYSEIVP